MSVEVHKEVLRIANREGLPLCAIVTRPCQHSDCRRLIISCQSGVVAKGEIGDHLRWVADQLAEQGVTVIRFDQHGTGDSPGEIARDIPIRLFFQKVQDGCFTDDTLSVIDWAVQHFPDYTVYLLGECGGCISALTAGAKRVGKIQGFILIAAPVLRFTDTADRKQKMGSLDVRSTRKQYQQKLLSLGSWLRLLRGKSNFKLIFSCMLSQVLLFMKKISLKILPSSPSIPDHPSFNMLFWNSFQTIADAKINICFLLPELDNETFEFKAEFQQKILNRHKQKYAACEVVFLPGTDHSIMFPDSRRLVVSSILGFIKRK